MCGLAGFFSNLGPDQTRKSLEQMLQIQSHRGPDSRGLWCGSVCGIDVGLGLNRLKILDLSDAANQPKRTLVCGTSSSCRGSQASAVSEAPPITIIANFSKRGDATKSFQMLTNRLPTSGSLTTFGDSLLLTLAEGGDAVREQWFGALQRLTKEVFVDSTNFPAAFFEPPKWNVGNSITRPHRRRDCTLTRPIRG